MLPPTQPPTVDRTRWGRVPKDLGAALLVRFLPVAKTHRGQTLLLTGARRRPLCLLRRRLRVQSEERIASRQRLGKINLR